MPVLKFREIEAMSSRIRNEDTEQIFQVTNEGREIKLTVTDGSTISGETDFLEISESLFNALESNSELNSDQEVEMHNAQKSIRAGINRLIDVLKYALGNFHWEQKKVYKKEAHQYSVDGEEWKVISHVGKISATILIDSHPSFNHKAVPFIQEMLDHPSMLLDTSLFHLHRARNQGSSPKHAIIDACIAVEVGVKEFFMMYKPELAPLLEKMPSPPVSKLYGDIMEAYTGKRFEHLGSLSQLAEKRNALVHSPSKSDVSEDEVLKHVYAAERAVYWLHSMLDRKNLFFPNLYQCREQALGDLKSGSLTFLKGVHVKRPDEFPLPKGADLNWFVDEE